MKYIKKFENSVDDTIYFYSGFPNVVGKIFRYTSYSIIQGFYINDNYSYLNYDGIKNIPIYHDKWIRPANEKEIKFYKELYEISQQTKKYNL